MPRQKLSEYRAKNIIYQALDLPYKGWQIDSDRALEPQLEELSSINGKLVVKVDEGVKGRFKKGLVILDVSTDNLTEAIQELSSQGFRWLIVEPQVEHDKSRERYISFMVEHRGLTIKYSSSGGVDIEAHPETVQSAHIGNDESGFSWDNLAGETGLSSDQLIRLATAFNNNYFVFMEINPYIVSDAGLQILDSAVEIDDAAAFFVDSWSSADIRRHSSRSLTDEEEAVEELDANSPASLKLSVLEPNGSIFLLLSGGGASVVVADEVYNQGYGKQLANYGEYSGNPNAEETYLYTKAVLQLLLKSSAPRKVLFIGGAVANFTDIAKTFSGVIKAIEEVKDELEAQSVKIFVRRGGPNQEIGLAKMEAVLTKAGLLGAVHDPSTPLTVAVNEALKELEDE